MDHLQQAEVAFDELKTQSPLTVAELDKLVAFQLDRVNLREQLQQPLDEQVAETQFVETIATATRLSKIATTASQKAMLAYAYQNYGAYLEKYNRTEESIVARREALKQLNNLQQTDGPTLQRDITVALHLDLARTLSKQSRESEAQIEQMLAKQIWQQYPLSDDHLHAYVADLAIAAQMQHEHSQAKLANQTLVDALRVALLALSEKPESIAWQAEVIEICSAMVIDDEVKLLEQSTVGALEQSTNMLVGLHQNIDPNHPEAFQQLRVLMETYGLQYRLACEFPDRLPASVPFARLMEGAPLLYGGITNSSHLAVQLAKEGHHAQSAALIEALSRALDSPEEAPQKSSGDIAYNQACALNYCAKAASQDVALSDEDRTTVATQYAQQALKILAQPETLAAIKANPATVDNDLAQADLAWLNTHYPAEVADIIRRAAHLSTWTRPIRD